MLADTCSIDAASSLTDDTSSSADAATDSACAAVSFSDAAISLTPLTAVVEAAHLRVGAFRRPRRRCARCRCADSVTCRRARAPAGSASQRRAAVRAVGRCRCVLRCHELLSAAARHQSARPTVSGLGEIQNASRFRTRISRSPSDAMPSTYRPLMPASASCGGWIGVRRNRDELARARRPPARQPAVRLDDDQPAVADRTARARSRTARAD